MSDTIQAGDWTQATLGEVCDINPPRGSLSSLPSDTPVFFVPMAAVDDVTGKISSPETRTFGEVRGKSYRSFESGDVLFAKITPCMENGKSAVVPDIGEAVGFGSTEFHVLRPKPGIDPWFIWFFVRQEPFRRRAEEHMTGSVGQLRVPAAFLRDASIAMPAHEVQVAIVRLLESVIDASRDAEANLAVASRAIQRFRAGVLSDACRGRLTAEWRDANPHEQVKGPPELSVQARKHTSGPTNTESFIEIPPTWSWWPVEGITESVIDYRGRTPPSQESGPIPHVRTTQIKDGRIDWRTDRFVTKEVYDKYMTRGIPRSGDVLFTMEAPLGEVGVVDREEPFSIAQRILLLRPAVDVSSKFLAMALRSHPVRRAIEYRSTGSGVRGIAYKRLRSVLIPKPPLAEQIEIVQRASSLLKHADNLEAQVRVARRSALGSTRAVLAKAFRGDLIPEGSQ